MSGSIKTKSHGWVFFKSSNLWRHLKLRRKVTCLRSHPVSHAELGFKPSLPSLRACGTGRHVGSPSIHDSRRFLAQGTRKFWTREKMLQWTKQTLGATLSTRYSSSDSHRCSSPSIPCLLRPHLELLCSFPATAVDTKQGGVKTAFRTVLLIADYGACSVTRGGFDYR